MSAVIKLIAVAEILGGLTGVLFLSMYLEWGKLPVLAIVFVILSLSIFFTCVVSGVLLWKNKRIGYKMTMVVQLLQTPYILTPPFAYSLIAGIAYFPAIYFVPESGNVYLNNIFEAGGISQLSFGNDIEYWGVGVNIFSLIMLAIVAKKMPNKALNN